jgi:hypothetical protein
VLAARSGRIFEATALFTVCGEVDRPPHRGRQPARYRTASHGDRCASTPFPFHAAHPVSAAFTAWIIRATSTSVPLGTPCGHANASALPRGDAHQRDELVDGHAAGSAAVTGARLGRESVSLVGTNRALRVAAARPRIAALVEAVHRRVGAHVRIAGVDGGLRKS